MDRHERPPPLGARLLGPVELSLGPKPLHPNVWTRRKARELLLLLLATPGHRLPRDAVLETLWPESGPSDRNSLYKTLYALRRALEPALEPGQPSLFIESSQETIGLSAGVDVALDLDRFESSIRKAETVADPRWLLRDALDLYRGHLLSDELSVDWAAGRREALRGLRLQAVLRLAKIELELGNGAAAIGRLQAVLIDDPFHEDVHLSVIAALMDCGQPAAAREHLMCMRELFAQELGLPVPREAEVLVNSAAFGTEELLSQHRPAILGLPGLPTETVGQLDEITRVRDRLVRGRGRLTTIVGTGGVGKTRIAIEAARRSIADFSDGIGFVDLSTASESSLIFPRIGQMLGVSKRPGATTPEVVGSTLRRRPRFLLVLDNLEHLPGAGEVVANLLERAPELRVLATSRSPLRIRAEALIRIEPLPLPSGESDRELRTNSAVALFLQRVHDWHGHDGEPVTIQLPIVAEICRRLDGLPLALELAAARYWEFGPLGLLEQIEDRFAILRDGPVDFPERQQTLDATLAWSCGLLSDDQLGLFRGLSVFAGGAEPNALQAVLGTAVAASAGALVDEHLAQWTMRDGRRRLAQLETMRTYARALLEERQEADALRRAHARHYAELAVAGHMRRPRGLEQVEHVRRLEREQENLHHALQTALEMDDPAVALRICVGMGKHWFTHGPTDLAITWIERSLERAGDRTSEESAWTALWGAALAWQRGDAVRVARFEAHAGTIWSALGSQSGMARLAHSHSQRRALEGAFDEALAMHRANLATFQQFADLEGIVFGRVSIAHALERQGRLNEALVELELALDAARTHHDLYLQAHVLARLPGVWLDRNELVRAESTAAEAERIDLLIGDRLALPWVSIVRCWIAWERGQYDDAYREARLGLGLFRESGDERNELCGLVACVAAAAAAGSNADAVAHARELVHRLATIASDEEFGLGLPPLADLLGRLGLAGHARLVFGGAMTACSRANISGSGQRGRYHASIREMLGSDTSSETIDAAEALDHAVAVLDSLPRA